MKLELYEPHMCCPTGLCGPAPDEKLLRLSETLKAVGSRYPALTVERYMISRSPMRFKQNKAVFSLLQNHGKGVLPVATFNGEIICTRRYPNMDEIQECVAKDKGVIL